MFIKNKHLRAEYIQSTSLLHRFIAPHFCQDCTSSGVFKGPAADTTQAPQSWGLLCNPVEHRWNEIDRGKTCPSATLSTTNPTCTDPGSNQVLRGGSPATNRLSHDTVFPSVLCLWRPYYLGRLTVSLCVRSEVWSYSFCMRQIWSVWSYSFCMRQIWSVWFSGMWRSFTGYWFPTFRDDRMSHFQGSKCPRRKDESPAMRRHYTAAKDYE
jgi:hypothetical protein